MFKIFNIKSVTVFFVILGCITANIVSRLWRSPMENAFLIIWISGPFVLFFVPIALAKCRLAHYVTIGFFVAATSFGIVSYHGDGQMGPEIPMVYLGVPLIQSILALLSSVVAAIDWFLAKRRDRRVEAREAEVGGA